MASPWARPRSASPFAAGASTPEKEKIYAFRRRSHLDKWGFLSAVAVHTHIVQEDQIVHIVHQKGHQVHAQHLLS